MYYPQAFFVMVQLPYLRPFDDANKRVSHLAANMPLIKGNPCPASMNSKGALRDFLWVENARRGDEVLVVPT